MCACADGNGRKKLYGYYIIADDVGSLFTREKGVRFPPSHSVVCVCATCCLHSLVQQFLDPNDNRKLSEVAADNGFDGSLTIGRNLPPTPTNKKGAKATEFAVSLIDCVGCKCGLWGQVWVVGTAHAMLPCLRSGRKVARPLYLNIAGLAKSIRS